MTRTTPPRHAHAAWIAHFCPYCGAEHAPDARVCGRCGLPLDAGAPARRRARPAEAAAVLALLLALGALAALATLGREDGDATIGFRADVAQVVAPLAAANAALSDDLAALATDAGPVLVSAHAALREARDSQGRLARLAVPDAERGLRRDAGRALEREADYLTAVTRALEHPSDAAAADLGPRAAVLRDAWGAVGSSVAGAGGRIGGAETLAAWTRERVRRAARRRDAELRTRLEREARARADRAARARQAALARTLSCTGVPRTTAVVATGVSCALARDVIAGRGGSGFRCGRAGAVWYCARPDGASIAYARR